MATGGAPSQAQAPVLPLFFRRMDIASVEVTPLKCYEVCTAAERVSGEDTITGAQAMNNLWRLYPKTREARVTLLTRGIFIRGLAVPLHNNNPFRLKDDGIERPSTKLWIDNIPISCADSEIELTLRKLGCEMRSDIVHERARNNEHKLTRFLTGRRYVFITVPEEPLEKFVNVSLFTASLYHKEMKDVKKKLTCSNCLEEGHHKSQCENDVVCRACKQPGHVRGECNIDTGIDDEFDVTLSHSQPPRHPNSQPSLQLYPLFQQQQQPSLLSMLQNMPPPSQESVLSSQSQSDQTASADFSTPPSSPAPSRTRTPRLRKDDSRGRNSTRKSSINKALNILRDRSTSLKRKSDDVIDANPSEKQSKTNASDATNNESGDSKTVKT